MILAFIAKLIAWITSLAISLLPAGSLTYELSSMLNGSSVASSEKAADSALLHESQLPADAVAVNDDLAKEVLSETWRSEALDLTLAFNEGAAKITAACNGGEGEASIVNGVLTFTEFSMQEAACPGIDGSSEKRSIEFFGGSEAYVLGGDLWLVNDGKAAKFVSV